MKSLSHRLGLSRHASSKSHLSSTLYSQGIFSYQPSESINQKSLYGHPELYEACFSFRDTKREVAFIREIYNKYSKGSSLKSIVELGSGPGTHAIALSRAGVSQVTGLDISDEMLGYARWRSDIGVDGKAGSSSRSLSFVKGDMTDFDLGKEHDMVICLLGTFSHMLSNEDASRAMACISRALRPGGVLLIELGHPGDLFDGSYVIGDCGKDMWEVPLSLPNGAPSQHKILVEWGAEFDEFDSVSQVVNRTVSVTTFCGEKVEDSLEEVVSQRQFTVQEIKLLGSINGLELDVQNGLYGEMDPSLNVGLRHEEAYRMIAVLKKTQ